MREWLLLAVIALGGILGAWLLIFKTLAALYEYWQSGREFDRLKREAASRRMKRPSELIHEKQPPATADDQDLPTVPPELLASLSDDDIGIVPIKPKPPAEPAPPETPAAEAEAQAERSPPEPPPVKPDETTTSFAPPPFPLPPAEASYPPPASDSPAEQPAEQGPSPEDESANSDDADEPDANNRSGGLQNPPRYDM